jgi:hypothetical protein
LDNTTVTHSFKTKTGICEINTEKLALTRNGFRGSLANKIYGNKPIRNLLLYLGLFIILLSLGIYNILVKDYIFGFLSILVSLYFVYSIFRNRSNSATPIIELKNIISIKSHTPKPPLIRGYFIVSFNETGVKKNRVIIMPGSLENGSSEFEKAVKIFKELSIGDL